MLTMHNTFSYFVNGNMRFYIETFNRAQKKIIIENVLMTKYLREKIICQIYEC